MLLRRSGLPARFCVRRHLRRSVAAMASSGAPPAELDPSTQPLREEKDALKREKVVAAIHATPTKAVVYATGGGVQVQRWTGMWWVGSASSGPQAAYSGAAVCQPAIGSRNTRSSSPVGALRTRRTPMPPMPPMPCAMPHAPQAMRDLPASPPPPHTHTHPGPLVPLQSMAWLLSVPGASGTVLETVVPYSRDSVVDLLGGKVNWPVHID
jgi:hypothetical protein